jgi:LAS superfamily LD-carboxypeptidase LdcB
MAKKKKRLRLKKGFKRFLVYFAFFLIVTIYAIDQGIKIHKQYEYEKTYEYKLTAINYPLEEAKKISTSLPNESLDKILAEEKYNAMYYQFINEKYFLPKNIFKYIEYYNLHKNTELNKVVALVNVHASEGWYNIDYETDLSKGYTMLVNKFYHINEDYKRTDIVNFSLQYAYNDNSAAEIVVQKYDEMQAEVKRLFGVQLMVNSSYRSYSDQEIVYKERQKVSTKYADSVAARPGHSEHQTGLGIDITSLAHHSGTSFGESEEGKWVKENCYKYGFIIRYPEGKEDITGYDNEPWHFRYVGEEVAKRIYDEQITFDEYYAYYIEK